MHNLAFPPASLVLVLALAAVVGRAEVPTGGPAPAALEESTNEVLSLATAALQAGRAEDAARQLDGWLTEHPGDEQALLLRAHAAKDGGNALAALLCLNRLLDDHPGLRKQADPASAWVQLRAAVSAELMARKDPNPPEPPKWTWPPFAVLQRRQAAAPAASGSHPAAVPPISARVILPAELPEAAILAERRGQWGETARASSQYGPVTNGAIQATGAPNVPGHLDDRRAWASASEDGQGEWLELDYPAAVHATSVRVRQSFNPGAVKEIDLFDEAGNAHVAWAGTDPARGAPAAVAWFSLEFSPTPFLVKRVRIIVDSPAVKGWNEIDAVQLVGE